MGSHKGQGSDPNDSKDRIDSGEEGPISSFEDLEAQNEERLKKIEIAIEANDEAEVTVVTANDDEPPKFVQEYGELADKLFTKAIMLGIIVLSISVVHRVDTLSQLVGI
jgi:hypothetical protein